MLFGVLLGILFSVRIIYAVTETPNSYILDFDSRLDIPGATDPDPDRTLQIAASWSQHMQCQFRRNG